MSDIQQDRRVLLQVMNVSSNMMRIHKGTKLGDFTPVHHVHVIDDQEMFIPNEQSAVDLQSVDLSTSALNSTCTQRTKLMELIKEFGDIFAAPDGSNLGCATVVQHEIKMEGPPIQQPV